MNKKLFLAGCLFFAALLSAQQQSKVCGKLSAIQENFDSTGSGIPNCWVNYSDTESYVRVRAYSNTSGPAMSTPNGLYLFTYETTFGIIATPELDNLNSDAYSLTFRARSIYSAGATIEIGYFAKEGVASSFVKLGSYTSTTASAIDNFSMDIKGVPSGVSRIVMRHTGTPPASVILDDFAITQKTLGISEAATGNNVSISPNPFATTIHISNSDKVSQINIIDFSGKIVKNIGKAQEDVDLASLPSGNYIADIILKDGKHISKKIIKKNP